MPWATTRKPGTDPKYRSREHREYLAYLKRELQEDGVLTCTAKVCVFTSRAIVNPNGRERDGLTAGHADNGINYDGPQHRLCNSKDGARRARARQEATHLQW